MSTILPDIVSDVQQQAFDRCIDLSLAMIEQTIGVGDHSISRQDRISRFLDDAQSGALDAMKVVNHALYLRTITEFVNDMGNSPLVATPMGANDALGA